MITLEDAARSIGRSVAYKPFPKSERVEYGVITGISETFGSVFVRYGQDWHSKATHADLLEFTSETGGGVELGGAATSPPSGGDS